MLTTESLYQQYQNSWSSLTPRQQAAFRGNLTWLLSRTTDPTEVARLTSLREATRPEGMDRPHPHRLGKPLSIFATRLELKRTRLTLRDSSPLGARISEPPSAAAIAHQLIGSQAQEHLLLLLLDVKNSVIGVHVVHVGTTDSCTVEAGDILRVALLHNAPHIILSHNHPSGDPTPSDADIQVTKSVVAAAQLLGIRVLDHLIVTDSTSVFQSIAMLKPDVFNRLYSWQ